MPEDTPVAIDEEFTDFIARQVERGCYGSASDVIRAGLRLLEERETKLEALRAALIEGERSGTSASFDSDAFIEEKRRVSSES